MPPRRRGILRIEARPSRQPDSDFHQQPAGIYEHHLDKYEADQAAGITVVQTEPLDTRPQRLTVEEKLGLPDKTQRSLEEPPREIIMTTGLDEMGQPIHPHFQTGELLLNADGLTHDLIHAAIVVVLQRDGFITESTALQRTAAGRDILQERAGDEDWSIAANIEEAIENALEMSGIRRGKINERFWENLAIAAAKHNIPVPDITPQQVAAIVDELNAMATRILDDETHDYLIPDSKHFTI